MNKEIYNNSKLEKIEVNQESKLENISHEIENVINNININLEDAKMSGEDLEKDFPNNSEINGIVKQTNEQAEEIASGSKNNILNIIRNSSLAHKIIKGAAMVTFLMGVKNMAHAENLTKDNQNLNKIESLQKKSTENPKPESYNAIKKINNFKHNDEVSSLNREACENLILNGVKKSESESVILNIDYAKQKITSISEEISVLENKLTNLQESSQEFSSIKDELSEKINKKILFENYLSEKENIKKEMSNKKTLDLNESQQEIIKNAPELVKIFDSAKQEVLTMLSSNDYLQKLKIEFNCNLDEAKKHQATRVSNVNSINYEFQSKEYLELSNFCAAYYDRGIHQIALPYNVDQEKLARLAKHELLHCATMSSEGISAKAKKLLSEDSFQDNKKYYGDDAEKEYFADATERYARLKILDMELERLGIKNVGEKLNEKQYDKMMDLFMESMFTKHEDEKQLNRNALDFINFTKDGEGKKDGYKMYKKLFNEIAANQENSTYQNSEWNYDNEINKA
ncbi:MAG: hypothetical protein ACOYL8_03940 [Patescibacteria group bacterium]